MKFKHISPNIVTEQMISENKLPPKFAKIAVHDFGMTPRELRLSVKSMSFKEFMGLMNAFGFEDYSDAREILMRGAGIEDRVGLEPQREDIDDDRASANQDAFDDDFVKWVDSEVIGSEYLTVYDIFDQIGVDEDPWMALEKMLPGGDAEKAVVQSDQIKGFISLLKQEPKEAIMNYVKSIDSLYDDDDLKDQYSDGEDYRQSPERYYDTAR